MNDIRSKLKAVIEKYVYKVNKGDENFLYIHSPRRCEAFHYSRHESGDLSKLHDHLVDAMVEGVELLKKEATVSSGEKSGAYYVMESFDNGYLAAVQNLAEKIGLSKDGSREEVFLRIVDFFDSVEAQKGYIAREAHDKGARETRENMRLELQRLRDKSLKQAAEAKAAGEKLVLEAKEAVEKSAWLAEEAATYDALLSNMT